jgi:NADH-quinone oxidoreductase subunit J
MLAPFFFYFFAALTLFFASLVVVFKNTTHGVFSLILTFLSAAGLFLLAGAEFLAMVLVIVYVGAVAVLFLFVVMMVGVDFQKNRRQSLTYVLLSLCVAGLFAGFFYFLLADTMVGEEEMYLSGVVEAIQSNTSLIATLPVQVQTAVLESFVSSFHAVFLVAAPVVAVGFFVALFLREAPLRTNEDYAAARKESAGEALG